MRLFSKIKMKLYLIVLLHLSSYCVSSLYCYWNAANPYTLYGSKTPYDFIRGDIRDSFITIQGCNPISIWSIMRHGKRNPGLKFGKMMQEAIPLRKYIEESYDKRQNSICSQDVENLRNWQPDSDMFLRPRYVAEEDYEEVISIAKRLKEAFPKLLRDLEEGSYKFRPAYGEYMKNFTIAFVQNIGNSNKSLHIEEAMFHHDYIAPHARCGKYFKEVRTHPDIYAEAEKYRKGPEFLAAKNRIKIRNGIEYDLSDENITGIYDLCRYYSHGTKKINSPWCALLTTDDLKVLEYDADLRHYYRNSYGNAINAKFGEPPLLDLFQSFQQSKENKGKKITSYITHSTTMDMIYTALKLFKDDLPLTAAYRNPKRKWRSSFVSTFAVNLVAVLNRCQRGETADYNIVFYLNEQPLTSLCSMGICSWEEFENLMGSFKDSIIDYCEFESDIFH